MHRVIAIDGHLGVGQEHRVADRRGTPRVPFPRHRRTLPCRGSSPQEGWNRIRDDPDDRISGSLQGLSLRIDGDKVCLSGEDVSDAIRTTAAGHDASVFSACRVVRDHLFRVQRDALNSNDIVAEGRDMTTVVFPDAWKKFFLDASEEERARRRFCPTFRDGDDHLHRGSSPGRSGAGQEGQQQGRGAAPESGRTPYIWIRPI
ncbi:MAG: (d)CMP kinase [Desulfobacterales bacterium]|nr:(d)CMP kinase [Desulfobacterales bacterium]